MHCEGCSYMMNGFCLSGAHFSFARVRFFISIDEMMSMMNRAASATTNNTTETHNGIVAIFSFVSFSSAIKNGFAKIHEP